MDVVIAIVQLVSQLVELAAITASAVVAAIHLRRGK